LHFLQLAARVGLRGGALRGVPEPRVARGAPLPGGGADDARGARGAARRPRALLPVLHRSVGPRPEAARRRVHAAAARPGQHRAGARQGRHHDPRGVRRLQETNSAGDPAAQDQNLRVPRLAGGRRGSKAERKAEGAGAVRGRRIQHRPRDGGRKAHQGSQVPLGRRRR